MLGMTMLETEAADGKGDSLISRLVLNFRLQVVRVSPKQTEIPDRDSYQQLLVSVSPYRVPFPSCVRIPPSRVRECFYTDSIFYTDCFYTDCSWASDCQV